MKTEDLVKKLAHDIKAEIEKKNEQGKDPITDEKIERMVKAQLEEMEKVKAEAATVIEDVNSEDPPVVRISGGFKTDEDAEDAGIDADAYKSISRGKFKFTPKAQQKMLMDSKQLRRYHTDDVAQKVEEFQELNDDLYIVGKLMAKKYEIPYVEAVRETEMYHNMKTRLSKDTELAKALYTSGSSAGSEWIPTGFSNQLVELVRLELKVANLFNAISMPTNPYTVPIQGGKATGYLISENTADEGVKIRTSTPSTGNFTFNAIKLAGRIVFSDEVDEDSIINMMGFTKSELAVAIAEAQETSIVNGDTSATHQDSNVTDSQDARKAYPALRYMALNNAGTATYSFSNASINTTKLRAMRKLALKYGVVPTNNAWIVSVNGYIQMLNLSEVLTMDKWGGGYTARFGELAVFDGSPIIVSEYMWDNLNASGKYDGTTTDRTSILYVYRPGFWIGNRSGITVKVITDDETDQLKVVAKKRVDFEDPYDATLAANPQVLLGYNIST